MLACPYFSYVDRPIFMTKMKRGKVRQELMNWLRKGERCRNVIRTRTHAFETLVYILRESFHFSDRFHTSVEEQLVKFLFLLAHNVRNRIIGFFSRQSGEIVSRQFHNVLRAIISLEDQFLIQPNGLEVSPEILDNNRFFPYFKVTTTC